MAFSCVLVRDWFATDKITQSNECPLEIAFSRVKRGARPEGLEPSTYGLEIRCSIRLSYGRTTGHIPRFPTNKRHWT
jgi:hypothetical protein